MRSRKWIRTVWAQRTATTEVNPSGGIAHKSGIGPKIDHERCETGIDERRRVRPGRGGNRMDAGEDKTQDIEGRTDREAGVERGRQLEARQYPIRRKWGSGATAERGNEIVWGTSTRGDHFFLSKV